MFSGEQVGQLLLHGPTASYRRDDAGRSGARPPVDHQERQVSKEMFTDLFFPHLLLHRYMDAPQPGSDSTMALGAIAPDPKTVSKIESVCFPSEIVQVFVFQNRSYRKR